MILVYDKGGALVTLEFDATLRVSPLGTATPAQHPTDPETTTGSRPMPIRLSAEVVISDSPIADEIGGLRATWQPLQLEVGRRDMIAGARVSGGPRTLPLPGPTITINSPVQVSDAQVVDRPETVTLRTLQYAGEIARVRDVLAELDRLRRESVRVAVLAKWVDYPDTVLTSIAPVETPADAVVVQLELVEVQTGTTESVEVQLASKAKPRDKRAEVVQPAGQQSGYALNPADDSLAKGLQKKLNTLAARAAGINVAP